MDLPLEWAYSSVLIEYNIFLLKCFEMSRLLIQIMECATSQMLQMIQYTKIKHTFWLNSILSIFGF